LLGVVPCCTRHTAGEKNLQNAKVDVSISISAQAAAFEDESRVCAMALLEPAVRMRI